MSELEVITAAVGGLAALTVVLSFIAVKTGMVEGSTSLRIIPPKKRRAAETEDAAQPRGAP